jgi:7,8-dihydroneopterin aldolase/epimerase/oxygenase
MMDTVFIEALELEALIGVYEWERKIRQPLSFDIEIEFDNRIPAENDAIGLTVDYSEAEIRQQVEASGYELLETLVERLATHLLARFPAAHAFQLSVRKPVAARALGSGSLGIRIRRTRE